MIPPTLRKKFEERRSEYGQTTTYHLIPRYVRQTVSASFENPLTPSITPRAFSFSKISSQFLDKSYVFSSLILLNSNFIDSDFSGKQLSLFFELKNLSSCFLNKRLSFDSHFFIQFVFSKNIFLLSI